MPSGADAIFYSRPIYMPFSDSRTDYCVEFEAVDSVMQGLGDKCQLVVNLPLVGILISNISKGSNNRLCDILKGVC